jgi:hypothetical protein
MHALLATVLGQLVTLAVGDRFEGHYVLSSQEHYFEGSNVTTPGGTLRFDWKRASVAVGYLPTLTLVPIVETPRELLVYHRGGVTGSYRWRRTTLSLSETMGYGERDFRLEAVMAGQPPPVALQGQNQQTQAPAKPGGTTPGTGGTTPGTGGTTPGTSGTGTPTSPTRPAAQGTTPFADLRITGALEHLLSKTTSFRLSGGYAVSGGMGHEAQRTYPLARGPDGTLSVRYGVDTRNIFQTALSAQLLYSETGSNSFLATLTEDYTHQFSQKTSTTAGAGVSFGRAEPIYGLPLYSVYPTGRVAATYADRVAKGKLNLSLGVSTSPTLDLTSGAVDPRVGGYLTASWIRDRVDLTASSSSSLSIDRGSVHAFDSIYAALTARYYLGTGISLDGGVRSTWQKYGAETVIFPTLVFFVGLSWGVVAPIGRPPKWAGK